MSTKVDNTYTTATDCGDMIKASYIRTGDVPSVRGGYIQDCPKARLKIALNANGGAWEALYDIGGDDCGISADNLLDVIALGQMDDANTTVQEMLTEGADILRNWAGRIRAIDSDNEALDALAEYLEDRADDADRTAKDRDACADIAEDLGIEAADDEDDDADDEDEDAQ